MNDGTEFEDGTQDQPTGDNSGKGKRDGKASGTGSMGQSKAPITPAFFEYMKRIGASMEQITQILRDWAHLKSDALTKRLGEFSRYVAKASAQPQVRFGGDFALVSGLLRYFGGRDMTAVRHKLTPEEQNKLSPR